jgi:two-component system, OmpR family, phosphate regulon sensor histidine kinase PhoR
MYERNEPAGERRAKGERPTMIAALRTHYRLIGIAALLAIPILLAFVPYIAAGATWAALGMAGGLMAVGWSVGVGVSLSREMRVLSSFLTKLENGEETEVPAIGSVAGHRVASTAVRIARSLTERCERVQNRLEIDDAIIESLNDPLFLVGADRQVVRANAAARALFGDRVAGRDMAASLRQPDVLEAVDAVLGGGASRTIEYALPVPVERVFEASVKPFRHVSGEDGTAGSPARMVVMTLHNITAIRRSEQMRADFIANASHELRTPLSSLTGFIETLRGPARDDADARDRFLGIMHEQATRMGRLVQDLLSLSRIELDEHMPPSSAVDVVSNVRKVIAALELKAAARGIRIALDVPEVVPPALGDDDQLTQVFQNLISNAVKYTRENTVVTVSVAVADGVAVGLSAGMANGRKTKAGPALAVAVADRGEGIARVHLPRLTERFYRVDAARSRALGGTGLGLAIVKHIMNRHRGRLTIESEVGHGSTFTVYLPTPAENDREEHAPLRRSATA